MEVKCPHVGLSSRANARDLRKISPFGRNDNEKCAIFAPATESLKREKLEVAKHLVSTGSRQDID